MIMHVSGRKGGKGGGGASRVAQEEPNTLRSKSIVRVLDGLGEGEIVGLVNGHKSIFFDDTPLQNADGSYNFQGISADTRYGTPDQDFMAGFPNVESESSVNQEIDYATPLIKTISDPTVNAVRITMRVPTLTYQEPSNGDLKGSSVGLAIEVQSSGGGWQIMVVDNIKGKTVSAYEKSYRIALTGSAPWNIRVTRLTEDQTHVTQEPNTNGLNSIAALKAAWSNVSKKTGIQVQNTIAWARFTAVIDNKLSYPDTAYIGLNVDTEAFGGEIPTRGYVVRGMKIRVPSNYDPETRVYTGIWNGSFQVAYSNNPAWVLYDLITNNRYGLGDSIDTTEVDKWGLYTIGQYCDEMVDDGFGGQEPRFTFNGILHSRDDAYRVVQSIASTFRGVSFWGTGTIQFAQDCPTDPVKLVTPANVIDGAIGYSGTGLKTRPTVIMVTWNDPADHFRETVEIVEDQDLIQKYGWKQQDLTAYGCSSRGQARRMGKWALDTAWSQTETISYRASLDHADVRPGDIISVQDPNYAGVRFGGRLAKANYNWFPWSETLNPASNGGFWTATGCTVTDRMFYDSYLLTSLGLLPGADLDFFNDTYIEQSGMMKLSLLNRTSTSSYSGIRSGIRVIDVLVGQPMRVAFEAREGSLSTMTGSIKFEDDAVSDYRFLMDFTAGTISSLGDPDYLDVLEYGIEREGNVNRIWVKVEAKDKEYSLGFMPGHHETAQTGTTYVGKIMVYPDDSVIGYVPDYVESTASSPLTVYLDAPVTLEDGESYSLSYVDVLGAIVTRDVGNGAGQTSVIQLSSGTGSHPMANAMWVLSATNVVPRQFRVMGNRQVERNIFEITGVFHDPNKYARVESDLRLASPSYTTLPTGPLSSAKNLASKGYAYHTNGIPTYGLILSWTHSTDPRVQFYEIWVKRPDIANFERVGTTQDTSFTLYDVVGGSYSFRVFPVDRLGAYGAAAELSVTGLDFETDLPADVQNFRISVGNDFSLLSWNPNTEFDMSHYEIRFSPRLTGVTWGNSFVVVERVEAGNNTKSVPSLVGTYLIKAVDAFGNYSENAAVITSDVASLLAQNVVEVIHEHPEFGGTYFDTELVDGFVELAGTWISDYDDLSLVDDLSYRMQDTLMGWYEFQDVVDLGSVFSAQVVPDIKFTAKNNAVKFNDIVNVNLAPTIIESVPEEAYKVTMQISITQDDPDGTPTWTPWEDLLVSNYTARAFRFRVILQSFAENITPVIQELSVTVDMPDRIEGAEDVLCTTAGYSVVYENPFHVQPSIAVSTQNLQTGDYYVRSNETRFGFDIVFKNAAGTNVARTFDWHAKGYGAER